MPEFRTEVAHQLGQEEALGRLKKFVDKVRAKFDDQLDDAEGSWTENILDFTLKAAGLKITGKLTVDDQSARVNGQLPFLAVPMRGMIERQIAEELQSELA
jgi:hypothetical protein